MYHNPSYDRYRIREKHCRIYVLTKTQIVFGFIVSLLCSVFLSGYLERYGDQLLSQLRSLMFAPSTTPDEGAPERQSRSPEFGNLEPGSSAGLVKNTPQAISVEERLNNLSEKTQIRTTPSIEETRG